MFLFTFDHMDMTRTRYTSCDIKQQNECARARLKLSRATRIVRRHSAFKTTKHESNKKNATKVLEILAC